jgi:hypothetical protein
LGQHLCPRIVAYDRHQPNLCTERGDVHSDIRRSTGTLLGRMRPHDRYWCFWRDSPGITEHILIQHHVACHENAQP